MGPILAPDSSPLAAAMAEVEKALLLVSQTECSKLNLKEGSIEMSLNVLDGDVLKEAISVLGARLARV